MNVSQPHLLANLLVKPALVQKRTLATGLLTNVRTLYGEKRTQISVNSFSLYCNTLSLTSQTMNVIGVCKVKIDH